MPIRETPILDGKPINVDLYQDAATTPDKAVIVTYGTEGMNPPFNALLVRFCEEVAKAGYLTVLPYYFESTGTLPGTVGVTADLNKSEKWIDTLASAIDFVNGKINGGKVAFVGFSLGANIVLNAALKRSVTAVVDYFAPVDRFGLLSMPPAMRLTQPRVSSLPPVLIHHGNRDIVVPDSQSQKLKGWLDAHGTRCELNNDYDCGHPGQSEGVEWTATAQTDSIQRTIQFLKTIL